MERRIISIIRWLERCLAACRANRPETALVDAECARADMERLRDELWTNLKTQRVVKSRFHSVLLLASAVFGAVAFVLASATPLTLPMVQERERKEPTRKESFTLEWVTPDEKALLGKLRKRLSDGNTFAVVPEPVVKLEIRATPRTKAVVRPEARPEPDSPPVPYDRIITLVRTGERALKNQEPLIQVERQDHRPQ
jgi:hypothetical protein